MGILQYILSGPAIFLAGNSLGDYINLDTLFIVVMVLAVIILIMLVTYFVSIKPNLNSSEKSNSSVDNVIAQITRNEEEELINDCELAAVITAAIYASMGDAAPIGGLVVRSIKRANTKKWMNA